MDLSKEYYTSLGTKCNILQMVKLEPEWAANRLQEGEKRFDELCELKAVSQPGVAADAERCVHPQGYIKSVRICGLCGEQL